MATYEWSDRLHAACQGISVNKKIDANDVVSTMQAIGRKKGGEIRPEDLVTASRPKRSKTHDLFEWDDSIASEKYRIEQAKYAIRSVRIVRVDESDKKNPVSRSTRAYQSVPSKKEEKRVYVSTDDAISDEEYRVQILQQCLNQLVAWRCRWNELNEYIDAFSSVDAAISEMQQTVARVS